MFDQLIIEEKRLSYSWIADLFSVSDKSWIHKLGDQCEFDNYSFGTGSRFGILYSIDSTNPEEKRVVFELNKESNRADFLRGLCIDEPRLAELSAVADLPGHQKDGFEYGIGISGKKGAYSINTYIGLNDTTAAHEFLQSISRTPMWLHNVDKETVPLIERISAVSRLAGFAKRYGSRKASYILYYAGKKHFSEDLIGFVTEGCGDIIQEELLKKLYEDGMYCSEEKIVYGWAIALDEDGKCPYIKLEISKGIDHIKSIKNDRILNEYFERLEKDSGNHEMRVRPQIISYRICENNISKTAYFNIEPNIVYDSKFIYDDYKKGTAGYYDKVSKILLKDNCRTYQAGLIRVSEINSEKAHNLYLAERAGIKNGKKVLDAGCGLGGPMVDIALHYREVAISGITNSIIQFDAVKAYAGEIGISERIDVRFGDYHELPYPDNYFDTVIFFESIGYAYDIDKLFAEVARVLKAGGNIYIKDVFCREGKLNPVEKKELDQFNTLFYQYNTPKLSAVAEALKCSGFIDVEGHDLSSIISTDAFIEKMFVDGKPENGLNEFGKIHFSVLGMLPVYFAEVKGVLN